MEHSTFVMSFATPLPHCAFDKCCILSHCVHVQGVGLTSAAIPAAVAADNLCMAALLSLLLACPLQRQQGRSSMAALAHANGQASANGTTGVTQGSQSTSMPGSSVSKPTALKSVSDKDTSDVLELSPRCSLEAHEQAAAFGGGALALDGQPLYTEDLAALSLQAAYQHASSSSTSSSESMEEEDVSDVDSKGSVPNTAGNKVQPTQHEKTSKGHSVQASGGQLSILDDLLPAGIQARSRVAVTGNSKHHGSTDEAALYPRCSLEAHEVAKASGGGALGMDGQPLLTEELLAAASMQAAYQHASSSSDSEDDGEAVAATSAWYSKGDSSKRSNVSELEPATQAGFAVVDGSSRKSSKVPTEHTSTSLRGTGVQAAHRDDVRGRVGKDMPSRMAEPQAPDGVATAESLALAVAAGAVSCVVGRWLASLLGCDSMSLMAMSVVALSISTLGNRLGRRQTEGDSAAHGLFTGELCALHQVYGLPVAYLVNNA